MTETQPLGYQDKLKASLETVSLPLKSLKDKTALLLAKHFLLRFNDISNLSTEAIFDNDDYSASNVEVKWRLSEQHHRMVFEVTHFEENLSLLEITRQLAFTLNKTFFGTQFGKECYFTATDLENDMGESDVKDTALVLHINTPMGEASQFAFLLSKQKLDNGLDEITVANVAHFIELVGKVQEREITTIIELYFAGNMPILQSAEHSGMAEKIKNDDLIEGQELSSKEQFARALGEVANNKIAETITKISLDKTVVDALQDGSLVGIGTGALVLALFDIFTYGATDLRSSTLIYASIVTIIFAALEAVKIAGFVEGKNEIKRSKEFQVVLEKISEEILNNLVTNIAESPEHYQMVIDKVLNYDKKYLERVITHFKKVQERSAKHQVATALRTLFKRDIPERDLDSSLHFKKIMEVEKEKIPNSDVHLPLKRSTILVEMVELIVDNNLSLDEAKIFLQVIHTVAKESKERDQRLFGQLVEAYDSLVGSAESAQDEEENEKNKETLIEKVKEVKKNYPDLQRLPDNAIAYFLSEMSKDTTFYRKFLQEAFAVRASENEELGFEIKDIERKEELVVELSEVMDAYDLSLEERKMFLAALNDVLIEVRLEDKTNSVGKVEKTGLKQKSASQEH